MRKPKVIVNLSPLSASAITKSNGEISSSNRDIASSNKSIAKELARQNDSRNRVDLSLEEYQEMKKKIDDLEFEVRDLRNILRQIEFPFELIDKIVPGSFETIYSEGPPEFNKPRRNRCSITFDFEADDWGRSIR